MSTPTTSPSALEARIALRQARIRATFAALALVLAILAIVAPQWLESSTALEPDGGSGLFEWFLAGSALLVALVSGAGAGVAWRRAQAAA